MWRQVDLAPGRPDPQAVDVAQWLLEVHVRVGGLFCPEREEGLLGRNHPGMLPHFDLKHSILECSNEGQNLSEFRPMVHYF